MRFFISVAAVHAQTARSRMLSRRRVAVPSASLKGTGVLSSEHLCGIKFNSLQSLVLQCICKRQWGWDALRHLSHAWHEIYFPPMALKAKAKGYYSCFYKLWFSPTAALWACLSTEKQQTSCSLKILIAPWCTHGFHCQSLLHCS